MLYPGSALDWLRLPGNPRSCNSISATPAQPVRLVTGWTCHCHSLLAIAITLICFSGFSLVFGIIGLINDGGGSACIIGSLVTTETDTKDRLLHYVRCSSLLLRPLFSYNSLFATQVRQMHECRFTKRASAFSSDPKRGTRHSVRQPVKKNLYTHL